jgi:hypothetical protein
MNWYRQLVKWFKEWVEESKRDTGHHAGAGV